jgi:deoxyribodipyrimidine photo-lyase
VSIALVLFNRDLRVHDNPALSAAARERQVIPLFVFDEALLRSRFAAPNRLAFLLGALRDLDGSLRARGARLFLRDGDPVEEAIGLALDSGADQIHVSADWSAYARRREARLAGACERRGLAFRRHPGVTVLPPAAVTPEGGDHFRVFGPYHRAWRGAERRPKLGAPRRLAVPAGVRPGRLPSLGSLTQGKPSPTLPEGGETSGRRRMRTFLRDGLGAYEEGADDLAADATSRLSPYLRWGCLSPLDLLLEARGRHGGEAFARQLCWRDFHHQVLAANPQLPRRDYRHRGDRWSRSRRALDAWREGRTGYPIVDAGMRQLAREGYIPNRARLIVASFLTKDLHLDWRDGARHFWDLLVDGEIANNAGNWQWVAGTGNDTRPNRVFNPLRQARRFDREGDYVRRHVPELAGIDGPLVHTPWMIGPLERSSIDYPEPIVNHGEAAAAFLEIR